MICGILQAIASVNEQVTKICNFFYKTNEILKIYSRLLHLNEKRFNYFVYLMNKYFLLQEIENVGSKLFYLIIRKICEIFINRGEISSAIFKCV